VTDTTHQITGQGVAGAAPISHGRTIVDDLEGYPADHDPLLPALMHALVLAEDRRDLNAAIVLRALLEHYEADTTGELAMLIELHRRPLPTNRPAVTHHRRLG